jgi:hypothetical protein
MRSIRTALLVVASVAVLPSATHAGTRVFATRSARLYTNGTVFATAAGTNRFYVGGDFTLLGRATGSWVGIGSDGTPVTGRPQLVGEVTAAVSDGRSGWFVAGKINAVGSVVRPAKLVHLRANGELDRAWQVSIRGGQVFALARRGGTLYLAGGFKSVGGRSRQGIAAVSTTTHRILPWHLQGGPFYVEKKHRNAAEISTVALASTGRTLYFGGLFNRVGKLSRSRLAQVSLASGRLTRWNPSPNGEVSKIEPAPGRPVVYLVGDFTRIGKESRNQLAAVDTRTGRTLAFDAGASASYDEPISEVLATRTAVYVAGEFTALGGKSRHLVAALDPQTGAVTDWEPTVTGDRINALAVDASQNTLYIAGDIVDVGGQRRDQLAAIDLHSGAVTGWDPPSLGDIIVLTPGSGGEVFAGGRIAFVGGTRRPGLASLTTDGAITDWRPVLVGTVRSLALSPDRSKLYVGGAFTPGDAPAEKNLAVVDVSTGALHAFAGGTSPGVWALAPSADGSQLYIGGAFTTVAGKRRTRLAQVDARTGELAAWNSGANDLVRALVSAPDALYVGGDFTSAGGQLRGRLAKLDLSTGVALGWNPQADAKVWALTLRDKTLYVGGDFQSIGGKARNSLAAVDTESGQAAQWDPNANSTVRSLALSLDRSHLYAGGYFGKIGSATRGYAEFLLPSGALTSWDADNAFDAFSMAFTSDGSALVIGGQGGIDIFR